MIKLTFKNIITFLGSLLFVVFLASFLFLIFNYVNDKKEYEEFKNKVKIVNEENKVLADRIKFFKSEVSKYEKEKQDLLDELAKKKTIFVDREKIIYVNGELRIPEDYLELKDNYLILGENYELVKAMYASLLAQSKKDSDIITKSLITIDDLKNANIALLNLLNNTPEKPTYFIEHSLLGGVGFTLLNKKSYKIGYMMTIMNKYQFEAIISFPPEISFLMGVKF